ncbi:MAG: TonB-dependent receptor, partial [Xanthomonadales bacterium]|nr:TonB-dependent receptor [Xanthomonadales bacterium]
SWEVVDDVLLRVASSRTLTRPNPRSMLPATTFSDPSAEIADQGNPNLAPYLSTNVDLGIEWYTGGEGLVALSLFNKRVSGYTFQGINVRPFRDLGIPFESLAPGQQAALNANGGLDAPLTYPGLGVHLDPAAGLRPRWPGLHGQLHRHRSGSHRAGCRATGRQSLRNLAGAMECHGLLGKGRLRRSTLLQLG